MSRTADEQILVIPRSVLVKAGMFQGFSPDIDYYLPRLLHRDHLRYLRRADAENDPEHKQIIPYVVLKWQDQLFHYTRGKRGSETRLQALRSIGVGGHINPMDDTLFEAPYREAMLREVTEEVSLDTKYEERCIGLINDDATPVGSVHLGIVHVFELAEPKVKRREQMLTQAGFAPLAELWPKRDEFETWSQYVLAALHEGRK